jgi:putative transposase
MPSSLTQPRNYLPRFAPAFYQGRAVVFWTHPIKDRATGWLKIGFHQIFCEIMLHAAVREHLVCPVYTLMPDHLHLVWMGVRPTSDQLKAVTFLRTQLAPHLMPHSFQHQSHDHVLRAHERKSNTFRATCGYIAENPVRAALAAERSGWPFSGCIVPGYFDLHLFSPAYWEKFWRIYNSALERGGVGKLGAP